MQQSEDGPDLGPKEFGPVAELRPGQLGNFEPSFPPESGPGNSDYYYFWIEIFGLNFEKYFCVHRILRYSAKDGIWLNIVIHRLKVNDVVWIKIEVPKYYD